MDVLAILLGPLVALAAGLAGWAIARRHAPPRAANDNEPWPMPPVLRVAASYPAAANDGSRPVNDAAG